ncbi:dihydrofolate reductase [Secundilactobacillus mixtipabuli]|uniref:Dihydrofolate reductase n=1 Tax=Secundilactobacillus mixtipabuli TaxID=1435342 RepID=A0A1Z5IEE2_9LACO|nr:dihydrofolate reductase [Secundilactobacillus mixtipabuli]GAX00125.1 dihydrofolate reductase [Secundilactobacillus mixtipabuli]
MIFIWAEDQQHAIGHKGQLPWHLPADMAFFKQNTIGKMLISGSRTFASYKKPLPHRKNIVLTSRTATDYPSGVEVLHSASEVVTYEQAHPDETVIISGGARVFKSLLPYVDTLLRTRVLHKFKADTYMPEIDYSRFKLVESTAHEPDEKNPYGLVFERWERR